MTLERFEKNMDVIAKLDDEPNDAGSLTAAELKAKFDEGGVALKEYINDVLIPTLKSSAAASELGAMEGPNPSNVQAALDGLKSDSHTHENESLLDSYTHENDDIGGAINDRHTHDNTGVLDSITPENKAVLDSIKAVTSSLGDALDKVPSERAVSDAMVAGGMLPGGGMARRVLKKRTDAPFDIEWGELNASDVGADPAAKGVTSGTASALVLSYPGFALADGACVRIRLHTMSIPMPSVTLDVNDTGAKPVVTSKGKPLKGANAGSWVTMVYSEELNSFILQGEGGEIKARSTWQKLLTNTMNVRGW